MQTQITPDKYFVMCNGVVLKNVKELALVIEDLTEWELRQHVNSHRNDFSAWIRDVFGDTVLAEKIKNIKDKREMQLVILKYLVKAKESKVLKISG
jgi:hypothetical protein